MSEWRSEERKWCYFHPRESVVGICALCLKERLLLLANSKSASSANKKNSLLKTSTFSLTTNKKSPSSSSSSLTKIFALSTLLNRLDIKDHHKKSSTTAPHPHFCRTSSSTPDDSFISIKFEDNGIASWDKGKLCEMSHDRQCEMSNDDKKIKSLVEHTKPRGAMRWRRRIGHIFQLIRLKKSSKGNICHVGTKHRKSKTLNTIEKM